MTAFSIKCGIRLLSNESLSGRRARRRSQAAEMEAATGVVKHVLLGKFKDDVSQEKIEEIIRDWANLVDVIEPMKDFHWGTDVSIENKNEGFTHIFVSTFESTEGVAEYLGHPAHVEYGKKSLPYVEKFIVFDYKPAIVNL